MLQVLGVGIVCGVCAALLKEWGGKYSSLVLTLGGVYLLLYMLRRLSPAFVTVTEYFDTHGLSEMAALGMKALGIGYLTETGAHICRDLGADSMAGKLELCGRAELAVLALPTISRILESALTLI